MKQTLYHRQHILLILHKRLNQRIGMIKRCFSNLNQHNVELLYKTMIRSVLEYRSSTWSPYYKKDKILLEIVQNRCLRLSKDKITLPTLENRRILYDLCEVFKYLKGYYKTGSGMFSYATRRLGGHQLKLLRPAARSIPKYNFLSVRAVRYWNSLPENTIETPSLTTFKRKLSTQILDDQKGNNNLITN